MALSSSEVMVTWGGLPEEEQGLRARLQAMALAVQAKDAALQDLQRRLQAASGEVEEGRAKEAALRRRAEIAEAAEEALASQMAELEAEAYASITQSNRLRKGAAVHRREDVWMGSGEEQMEARQRIEELERRLEAAREEAGRWERRFREAERVRQTALLEMAEKAEPTYAPIEESRPDGHVAELQRRLAAAERELEAVHAKLREAEHKNGGNKQQVMSVKRKEPNETVVVSMSLQELAGMIKLRLWSPASLMVSSA